MVPDCNRQHEPSSMLEHGPAVRFVDGYGAFAVHCPLAVGPVIQQAGFLIDSDQKRPGNRRASRGAQSLPNVP